MSASALSARDLRVVHDGRVSARLDALHVAAGEAVALVGPNGSGKSTLLRTLALVERPTAGTVALRGADVPQAGAVREAARRSVTLALPAPWLFAGTALSNVERGLAARGAARGERRRRALRALDTLGVAHLADRDAKRLSSGEAARVSLARALVLETPVLLLDEPFAHLDADAVPAVVAEVRRRRAAGAAVVLAALDVDDLHGLAERAVPVIGGA